MNQGLLASRHILITGAAAGIGAAAAVLFAEEGARITLLDRNVSALNDVAVEIASRGGKVTTVAADVTNDNSLSEAVAHATAKFGAFHGAFNNAGIPGSPGGLSDISYPDWNRILDINVLGIVRCMRHQVPAMVSGGAIVNTTSLAGLIGAPTAISYSASKHAVIGITKSAALEYGAANIRINAIAPGPTRTAMLAEVIQSGKRTESDFTARTALKRMADPREIAEAALWLLSPRSSYVTGHVLVVDGGQMAS